MERTWKVLYYNRVYIGLHRDNYGKKMESIVLQQGIYWGYMGIIMERKWKVLYYNRVYIGVI